MAAGCIQESCIYERCLTPEDSAAAIGNSIPLRSTPFPIAEPYSKFSVFFDYTFLDNSIMFIGDAVPVKGDIPIFVDEAETRNSLKLISQILNVNTYYPAWDRTYDRETMESKLKSL